MKQKKAILFICLIFGLLLLALAAGGVFVFKELGKLRQTERDADALLGEQKYIEALAAYGQLLQRTPISFTGLDGDYADRGVQGVRSCANVLTSTDEGSLELAKANAIESALTLATHPAVPDDFRADMDDQAQRCADLLAEAEARALREKAQREVAEA